MTLFHWQLSWVATCALFLSLLFSAYAFAGDSTAIRATVEQLQSAEQRDYKESTDSNVSPARQADFASHGEMANRAIRELEHGYSVPPEEMEEASEVPLKSVRAQKQKVLAELREVREQQRADEKLNYGDNQVGLDRLRVQEAQTSKVMELLEIDEFVPWNEIVRAIGPGRAARLSALSQH